MRAGPDPENFSAGTGLLRVARLETLDPTGGIDQLLFAGEERMARGTDLHAVGLSGGPSLVGAAAGAADRDFVVLGMDFWFHGATLVRQTLDYRRSTRRALASGLEDG